MPPLNIGEVAERAGVTTPTVRYYESIGLLKKPARSDAGYRRYSEATVAELQFIKKARALFLKLAPGHRQSALAMLTMRD